jgi:vitamin B12 transporter
MLRSVRVCLLLASIVTAVVSAAAEEPKKLDPVVVTATKSETPAEQLGASVTVVPGEDFKTYHYETAADALRNIPGVEIRRSGSLGKTTGISIRGARSNQVQVLVDGVRVKSPTSGNVDFSDISPDNIERIEVIRGPQSTLYGADAIGGVVHIITKKGKGPFSASVEAAGGNYDTYAARAGFGGSYSLFDYSGAGSHLESNGQFKNDDSDLNALSTRLGLTLPGESSVSFTYRWNRNETGLPVKFVSTAGFSPLPINPIIDSNNRQVSETSVMALAGHTHPVSWWSSDLRLGWYRNTLTFVDLPDPADQCPFGFGFPCEFPGRFKVERREAEWINHFHIGKWSTSSFGVEYRRDEGRSLGASPFAADHYTWAGFFQQQFRFFERLFMSAGVRVEDNNVYGQSTTERGSLAYVIREWGTRIRGGAGSGFRAPTFNDLFFPGFSDPNLKPEDSFSWDVGVDQKLWNDRIRLGLTYFHNDFTNLISFEPIATPPFVRGVNIGRARTRGWEVTSEVDLLDTLTASVNYTYTDTENLQQSRPLPREPLHRWNIGLGWRPVPRLQLFSQVHVVSEQFELTGPGNNGVYNSGYVTVDVGGTWRLVQRHGFLQSLDAFARIQNLLNEQYAEVRGFPALGINALVGLRAAF